VIERSRLPAALAIAAVAFAGCGDGKKKDSGGSASTSGAGTTATTAASPPSGGSSAQTAPISKDTKHKPSIPRPSGPPPPSLVVRDVVKGKGRAAKAGDALTMQYVGVSYSNGQEFDASWDRGQPFEFQLGAGMVIPGWDQGLVGIKPGGRRELIIPPNLGYGPQGQPPAIGPNETLLFVVDAVKVRGG
jgi:peptidylprolyl isomerase